jgi:hypothetical protein
MPSYETIRKNFKEKLKHIDINILIFAHSLLSWDFFWPRF